MARKITVWWCEECGYWRKEKTSGVHQTANSQDPSGRMVLHELAPVEFVAYSVDSLPERPPGDGTETLERQREGRSASDKPSSGSGENRGPKVDE